MFKFKLGEILKDKITGFTGVVLGRAEYATGCIQYGLLSPKLNKEGESLPWHWIDQVRLITTGKKVKIGKDDSGPAPAAPEIN